MEFCGIKRSSVRPIGPADNEGNQVLERVARPAGENNRHLVGPIVHQPVPAQAVVNEQRQAPANGQAANQVPAPAANGDNAHEAVGHDARLAGINVNILDGAYAREEVGWLELLHEERPNEDVLEAIRRLNADRAVGDAEPAEDDGAAGAGSWWNRMYRRFFGGN